MDNMTFDDHKEHVGEGWWPIVKALHTTIDSLAPGYEVLQIKEKFGGLRFYYRLPNGTSELATSTIHVMTDAAEALSFRTCENCGKPGTHRNSHGWWFTLCDEHFAEREEMKAREWGERAERRTRRDMDEVQREDE